MYSLVVVGGGPGGISLAIECIELGLDTSEIIVFEKGQEPIAAIRQFYPEKKMTLANYKNLPPETEGHIPSFPDLTKSETLVYFDQLIKKYKIDYRTQSEVHKIEPRQGFHNVFVNHAEFQSLTVGIGVGILGRPNKPSYKIPLKLRKKCLFDLTTEEPKKMKVLVVGGGDTASEYCQILSEENRVTLSYRGIDFHRMMNSNREAIEKLVKEKKLELRMQSNVVELQESECGVLVQYQDGENQVFDRVVYALGGSSPAQFLSNVGIALDEKGSPVVDESGATNVEGVYVTGDLAFSKTGGSIVTSYNASYRAAQKIVEYVESKKKK